MVPDHCWAMCNGCVNGVILLRFLDNNIDWKRDCLGLWNPATREFKFVTYPNVAGLIVRTCFEVVGFGFDVLSNDFKILGGYSIKTDNPDPVTYYEVYSLRTCAYRRLVH